MKKSSLFQKRERKRSNKQDLKVIYILSILANNKGLTASQIAEQLESEGIIVEHHYVSRIIRLLRDEMMLPVIGGNGRPFSFNALDTSVKYNLSLEVKTLYYRNEVVNHFGGGCVVSGNTDGTFTIEVNTEIDNRFYRWLLAQDDYVKLVDPPEVVNSYKVYLLNNLARYF